MFDKRESISRGSMSLYWVSEGVDHEKRLGTEALWLYFVLQEDIVMGTLTVRENLAFSATLRISNLTNEGRKRLVNDVIAELSLQKCADTKVRSCTDAVHWLVITDYLLFVQSQCFLCIFECRTSNSKCLYP